MPKQVDKSTKPEPKEVLMGAGAVDLESIGEEAPLQNDMGLDIGEYMQMLDKVVSGGNEEGPVIEEKPVTQEPEVKPTPPSEPTVSEEDETQLELERVSKAYSDSSREAKRLAKENDELKEYSDYMPILDELKGDPELVQHVNNYLEGNDATERVATRLGLSDEFIYDEQEAINDPKSDSAKVLKTIMNDVVKENLKVERDRVRKEIETTRQQDTLGRQRDAAAEKYNLSLEGIDELEDWAKSHTLSYDDLYWLKNRDARDQKVAEGAVKDVREQSRKMSKTPKSLASAGSGAEVPVDPDKEVFIGIQKAMGGMQGIFDVD